VSIAPLRSLATATFDSRVGEFGGAGSRSFSGVQRLLDRFGSQGGDFGTGSGRPARWFSAVFSETAQLTIHLGAARPDYDQRFSGATSGACLFPSHRDELQ